ncbi:MAG: L-aspartate oxidase, partial [Desulfoprunum sp.]|nr:L-aspartate oxidase [Desulfoprunum sp.]
ACTGLHGANRLASNSLLEAVVYAERSYTYCKKRWSIIEKKRHPPYDPWKAGTAQMLDEEILINHNWDQIRRIMWNYVGIVRREKRLLLAQQRILEIQLEIEQHYRDYYVTTNMVELRNIAQVAALIISASLQRKESRGLHYVLDYPEQSEAWRKWNIFKRKKSGNKGILGMALRSKQLLF